MRYMGTMSRGVAARFANSPSTVMAMSTRPTPAQTLVAAKLTQAPLTQATEPPAVTSSSVYLLAGGAALAAGLGLYLLLK